VPRGKEARTKKIIQSLEQAPIGGNRGSREGVDATKKLLLGRAAGEGDDSPRKKG